MQLIRSLSSITNYKNNTPAYSRQIWSKPVHTQVYKHFDLSYRSRMSQDKIHHNLIQINQLLFDNEPVKFAIPLFFQAIKISLQRAAEEDIHARTYKKLRNGYENFKRDYQEHFRSLDQVHTYMLQEADKMVESEVFKAKSTIRYPIFSSIANQLSEDSTIVLEQQIYYFSTDPQTSSSYKSSSQKFGSSVINRPLSLDAIPSKNRNQGQIEEQWQRLQQYYAEHRLDEAYLQYTNFKKTVLLQQPNCQPCEEKKKIMQKVEEEYNMMTHYYQFFEEPGYIFDKEEKGVQMLYKVYEDSNEVSVRVQAELDISIQVFLCIVSEIDLFEKYIPFSYQTKELGRLARNQKIGTTKVYLPLLSDREAYFFAAAYDRLKTHNSIFFLSKTIASDLPFQKKINFQVPKNPDLIELQYKFYILEYRPTGYNRGKIRLSTNIDLKLSFLPSFVINKTCRIFAFDYFKNLIKVSSKFQGSEWQSKMQQNKQTYDFFKERIKTFLSQQQQ